MTVISSTAERTHAPQVREIVYFRQRLASSKSFSPISPTLSEELATSKTAHGASGRGGRHQSSVGL